MPSDSGPEVCKSRQCAAVRRNPDATAIRRASSAFVIASPLQDSDLERRLGSVTDVHGFYNSSSVATVTPLLKQVARLIRCHWHACAHHHKLTVAVRRRTVGSKRNTPKGMPLCNRR